MAKYTLKLLRKRVLVLGGSSGIGFCVAEAAIEHGAVVIISSSQRSKIDSSVDQLLQTYPNAQVTGCVCDLSNQLTAEDNLKALMEFATKDGKLDHIVNTAGDVTEKPSVSGFTLQTFQAAQQVRLIGSMLLAKYATTYMNQSNTSSLTLTNGVDTMKPRPGWSIYVAAVSGIQGLTKGLAVDLAPIRVNCVCPGPVKTGLWDRTFKQEELEKIENVMENKLLTKQVGRPEDVAEAYLYFMKDQFVDGQILYSEGGYLLA